MADLASVESALVAAIAQIVYPDGTGNPSIAGVDCSIYRGWPVPQDLDRDLAAGAINVTVFAQDNERNVTRYPREWRPASNPDPALTLVASGIAVTVGGTASSPLNACVSADGEPYVYAVQPGDTPTTVATALATLIAADTPATSSGPVITIPGAYRLSAAVGGIGTLIRETKRQRRGFMVTCWCPDPDSRDQVAGPLDAALADIDYLALPDGTSARLIYEKTRVSDRVEREGLYRRDIFYSAEYATTDAQPAARIVATLLNLADWRDDPLPGTTPVVRQHFITSDGRAFLTSANEPLTVTA